MNVCVAVNRHGQPTKTLDGCVSYRRTRITYTHTFIIRLLCVFVSKKDSWKNKINNHTSGWGLPWPEHSTWPPVLLENSIRCGGSCEKTGPCRSSWCVAARNKQILLVFGSSNQVSSCIKYRTTSCVWLESSTLSSQINASLCFRSCRQNHPSLQPTTATKNDTLVPSMRKPASSSTRATDWLQSLNCSTCPQTHARRT